MKKEFLYEIPFFIHFFDRKNITGEAYFTRRQAYFTALLWQSYFTA
jgi:hypothetical protein